MSFHLWLVKQGRSVGTASKYVAALRGTLSTWANDANITRGLLDTIADSDSFQRVAREIRALPFYSDRNSSAHNMYHSALVQYERYIASTLRPQSEIEEDIDELITTPDATERAAMVKARVGQGAFRQRLVDYWERCAVTGLGVPALLVASHIKPWRSSTGPERVDVFNGLLLLPNLDRAFDGGYITFDIDGRVQISPRLEEPASYGIDATMRVVLAPKHQPYMSFHRAVRFLATHT